MEITVVPLLRDNYGYVLFDRATGFAAVVDPSEAGPVEAALAKLGVPLAAILNTHHHYDHVGGNEELRAKFRCPIYAAYADAAKVPGCDKRLTTEEAFVLGPWKPRALAVPGHTLGATAYWFEKEKAVFTGDTLFVLGCGRLFEGTAKQMHDSLQRLAALPDDTKIYCGHEYALSNLRFAKSLVTQSPELDRRGAFLEKMHEMGNPSVPATMAEERATNPFLLARSSEDFALLRKTKDSF